MLKRHQAAPPRKRNPDQIEPPFEHGIGVRPHAEFLSGAADPASLLRGWRAAIRFVAAVFHLTEQQQRAPLCHKVDFASPAPPPPRKDAMSGHHQIEHCQPFSSSAGTFVAPPVTHPSGHAGVYSV